MLVLKKQLGRGGANRVTAGINIGSVGMGLGLHQIVKQTPGTAAQLTIQTEGVVNLIGVALGNLRFDARDRDRVSRLIPLYLPGLKLIVWAWIALPQRSRT